MELDNIHAQVGLALGAIGIALLGGKAIRRILALPFEYIASRTSTKVDDVIVKEAEADLGIDSTMERADATDSKK